MAGDRPGLRYAGQLLGRPVFIDPSMPPGEIRLAPSVVSAELLEEMRRAYRPREVRWPLDPAVARLLGLPQFYRRRSRRMAGK